MGSGEMREGAIVVDGMEGVLGRGGVFKDCFEKGVRKRDSS